MERKSYLLYQAIKEDAKDSKTPFMIVSGNSVASARYYAGLPSFTLNQENSNRDLYFNSLKHNLGFYSDLADRIYFCMEFRPEENELYEKWKSDPLFTELGWSWNDNHHKKRKSVFKCNPTISIDYEVSHDNILKNGDLSDLLNEKELQSFKASFSGKIPSIEADDFVFPKDWSIYHSITRKSDASVRIIRENKKNYFDVSTKKNYLSVISPSFSAKAPLLLCFSIQAVTESQIDLIVHLQNSNGKANEFYPYFPIYLPAGTQKEAKILLPAFPGRVSEKIHFWLSDGHVRLSDIFVYPVTMKELYQLE